jgi:hypothetical protein
MKTTLTASLTTPENWNGNKHKLNQLFAWVTGYDILAEGSREDMRPEKMLEVLKNKKSIPFK